MVSRPARRTVWTSEARYRGDRCNVAPIPPRRKAPVRRGPVAVGSHTGGRRVYHGADLRAQDGDGADADDGDEGQQQAVLGQGGALLGLDELPGGGDELGHGEFLCCVGFGGRSEGRREGTAGSWAGGPVGDRKTAEQTPAAVELNMELILVPRTAMAPMQMTAMRASSRPYSARVAPSSALTNFLAAAMSLVMVSSSVAWGSGEDRKGVVKGQRARGRAGPSGTGKRRSRPRRPWS